VVIGVAVEFLTSTLFGLLADEFAIQMVTISF